MKGLFKFQNNDFRNFYNFLISKNKDFILTQSNSSITITYENKTYPFFTENRNMKKVFSIVKKIKKYIDQNETKFKQDKTECIYNSCNYYFDFYKSEKIFSIDISSCYISIARNIGMISKELFQECFNLKKNERLMVMGMLAYNPSIFVYRNGKESDCYRKNSKKNPNYELKNDYSENFFRLVYETDKIFLELEKKLKNDFAFFWVDCVVFKGEHNIKKVCDFLNNFNLKYKIERIYELEIENSNSYKIFKAKKYCKEKKKLIYKNYTLSPFCTFEKQNSNEIFKAIKNGDTKKIKKIFFEKSKQN